MFVSSDSPNNKYGQIPKKVRTNIIIEHCCLFAMDHRFQNTANNILAQIFSTNLELDDSSYVPNHVEMITWKSAQSVSAGV